VLPKPVHFGLSLPPIGSSMGEIGAKVMDSFSSIPITNIPGPPTSFYTDSFQFIRNKKGSEDNNTGHTQENKNAPADPQDTLQLQQNSKQDNLNTDGNTPNSKPVNDQETLSIPESATLANSPSSVQNDMLTAQQYDQSLDGNKAIQDVSPV
jgi:hypothetical protein